MHCIEPSELQRRFYTSNVAHYQNLFRGSGLPRFEGVHTQKGRGLLGDVVRSLAIPVLKKTVPHAISAVKDAITDIKQGKPIKKAVRKAVRRTATRTLRGAGRKKRPQKKVSKRKRTNWGNSMYKLFS